MRGVVGFRVGGSGGDGMGNETGGERARGWGRALPSLVYSTPSVDSSPGRWVRTAVDRVQGAGAKKEDKVCACTHRCQLASRAPTSGLPCPVGRAGLTVTMRAATAVAAGRTGRIWPRSNCSGGSFGGACRPIFLRGGRFRWGRFAARKTCRVQGLATMGDAGCDARRVVWLHVCVFYALHISPVYT
jgi:hypothetical protein